jgi:antitoxin CptB
MTDPATAHEHRLKRLRFRAWRRGFREIDLILGGYADAHAATMSEADLVEFEALLDEADQDVYAWIIGQEPAPAERDTPLMQQLRAFSPAVK